MPRGRRTTPRPAAKRAPQPTGTALRVSASALFAISTRYATLAAKPRKYLRVGFGTIALHVGEAGLRGGEIIALEWGDVYLNKRQLCVERSDWKGHM